jgi:hypothetical protein
MRYHVCPDTGTLNLYGRIAEYGAALPLLRNYRSAFGHFVAAMADASIAIRRDRLPEYLDVECDQRHASAILWSLGAANVLEWEYRVSTTISYMLVNASADDQDGTERDRAEDWEDGTTVHWEYLSTVPDPGTDYAAHALPSDHQDCYYGLHALGAPITGALGWHIEREWCPRATTVVDDYALPFTDHMGNRWVRCTSIAYSRADSGRIDWRPDAPTYGDTEITASDLLAHSC